ncbi:MAG: hypothetical protein ACKVOH_03130, partial [Chlamydiales bacterium]
KIARASQQPPRITSGNNPKLRLPMKRYLLLLFLLVGCKKSPDITPPYTWHPVLGREEQLPNGKILRRPVYRVKVPTTWARLFEEKPTLFDTTKPNCEYLIADKIHVTVHSFPSNEIEERIPPLLQVERWQKQLNCIEPRNLSVGVPSSDSEELTQQILGFSDDENGHKPLPIQKSTRNASKLTEDEAVKPKTQVKIEPVHQGGFTGLYFAGEKGDEMIRAWSFHLDPELYQVLAFLGRTEEECAFFKQMRACFTIKVMGPADLCREKQQEIDLFIQSFELYQAIPAKL